MPRDFEFSNATIPTTYSDVDQKMEMPNTVKLANTESNASFLSSFDGYRSTEMYTAL